LANETDTGVMFIEARTIRKVRIRILPFVFLLFVVALLDRNNIAFAALTMNKELAITSQQYGLIFGIFFIGYFFFEIPQQSADAQDGSAYFLLPSRPQEAKFLTADEKEWIRAELRREEQQKLEQPRYSALQALASRRVWHLVLIYFGLTIGTWTLNSWAPQSQVAPSVYFGNELVWNAPLNPGSMAMDGKGRVWFNVQNRPDLPGYCKAGSNNPYAKYSPRESVGKGVDVLLARTQEIEKVHAHVFTGLADAQENQVALNSVLSRRS